MRHLRLLTIALCALVVGEQRGVTTYILDAQFSLWAPSMFLGLFGYMKGVAANS